MQIYRWAFQLWFFEDLCSLMFCFPLEPAWNKLTSNKISTHKKHEAHHGWAPYRPIKNVFIRIHQINDYYVKKYNINIKNCKVLAEILYILVFMYLLCYKYVHSNYFYFKAGICWLEVYKCIAESNFLIKLTSFTP